MHSLKGQCISGGGGEGGRALCHENTVIAPMQNGVPWWYFQRHGGEFDGRIVGVLTPRLEAVFPLVNLLGRTIQEEKVYIRAHPFLG